MKNDPKQERDDIRFTHIAIPTSFYILKLFVIWKCVFCCNMSYTGGVCYLWVLPSLHLFTFFCNMKVCVLLEHVLISYTGGVCYLWVLKVQ